jgi:hypothetical protein
MNIKPFFQTGPQSEEGSADGLHGAEEDEKEKNNATRNPSRVAKLFK